MCACARARVVLNSSSRTRRRVVLNSSSSIAAPVLGGPEVVHNPAIGIAVQGKKRQGSPCSLGETDLTCDN